MSDRISPQDAAILAQLRRKQALKDECLHAQSESPLFAEADKLLALADMARERAPGPHFAALLEKEAHFIESLRDEMRAGFDEMPPVIRTGAAGTAVRNSLILLDAALSRVTRAVKEENPADALEEAAFLLHGAGE